MNAFDTDVFSEILLGNAADVSRLSLIPADQQAIPIIVAEEILRGRLSIIRQAEAGKFKLNIDIAYHVFEATIRDLDGFKFLRTLAKLKLPISDGESNVFGSQLTSNGPRSSERRVRTVRFCSRRLSAVGKQRP